MLCQVIDGQEAYFDYTANMLEFSMSESDENDSRAAVALRSYMS